MGSREVKEYLSHHLIPQLLESLLTGLLYHRPEDPVSFLDNCLIRTRQLGGPEAISWDTFIHLDRDPPRPGPPRTTSVTTLLGPTTLSISSHVSLLAPISLPITPPLTTTFTVAPLTSSIKSNTPVVAPPPVSSGPPKMTRVLHPTPPGPAGALPPRAPPPLVQTEVKDEDTSEALPPPGLPRSPVQSQLSIDSDSDMTESSGLLQEVSILHPQRSHPLIIFIIGGPGSGKGSQTARLVRCFGLRAISLGDLLRKQLLSHASPSRKWEVISEMMGHGELGPQEETISELRRQLIGQRNIRGFIVDGFPQDVHQALSFQEQIGSPDLVMLLLCSNETLRCRLQQRASQLGVLGDSSHTLRRRLDTFQRDIVSLRRYYSQTHLLTQVDADREEGVVFADLRSVIREKLQLKDQSDPTGIPECISEVHDVQHQI